jgi:hypothetical protein
VSGLLGAEVALFSDEVLYNEHVSPDLLTASPLVHIEESWAPIPQGACSMLVSRVPWATAPWPRNVAREFPGDAAGEQFGVSDAQRPRLVPHVPTEPADH